MMAMLNGAKVEGAAIASLRAKANFYAPRDFVAKTNRNGKE